MSSLEDRVRRKRHLEIIDLLGFLRSHGDLLHRLSALISLVLLIVAFSIVNNNFLTMNNTMTVLLQSSVMGLLGIGLTVVIITAGIDLSVGSVLALSGVSAGLLVKAGVPVPLGMLGGVIVGTL
ncbi:MAG TPA: hypothetical protein VFJ18_09495, partial [Pararhizobium sp.]|nr:hypothetical protein [Pararhizobium sp.]